MQAAFYTGTFGQAVGKYHNQSISGGRLINTDA